MGNQQSKTSKLARRWWSLLSLLGLCAGTIHAESLYIDYSPKPRLGRLTKPTLCILDPHAKVDFEACHEQGHRLLAYVSLVELAKGSASDAAARKRGVPFIGTNKDWNSHELDVLSPQWRDFIIDDCVTHAIAQGYDGVFLDTLDSVESIAGKDAAKLRKCSDAIIALVRSIRKRWPNRVIVLNRGFAMLKALRPSINGVLMESVFQSFDPATKHYRPVSHQDNEWMLARIREVQALKLAVYAVDYVAPTDKALAAETAARLKKLGCIPFVSTHDLEGEVLAPPP